MHYKPTVVLYGNGVRLFIDQQMAKTKTIFGLFFFEKKNLTHKTKQNIDWY